MKVIYSIALYGALFLVPYTLIFAPGTSGSVKQPEVIVFGDSFNDMGRLNYQIGHTGYWRGRYSNGPVWPEYLAYIRGMPLENDSIGGSSATELAGPPLRMGYNIPSFKDQFMDFKSRRLASGELGSDDDFVAFNFGMNAFWWAAPMVVNGTMSPNLVISDILRVSLKAIDELIDLGFRRIVFLNAGPLDLIPCFNDPKDKESTQRKMDFVGLSVEDALKFGTLATNYANFLIDLAMLELRSSNDPRYEKVSMFDLTNMSRLIASDKEIQEHFNLTIVEQSCINGNGTNWDGASCSNPENHFFFDCQHPTTKIHALMGALVNQAGMNSNFVTDKESIIDMIDLYDLSQKTSDNLIEKVAKHAIEVESVDGYVPGNVH
ncbi:hypothetical protein H4219_001890 [Mycoemilia scoparia]|uniref:Uncharacterized protein n=1 Tax=Mycoemilia scoparia TaxID=417184 RepID=A0A9W8A5F8_9FUNG|nr:hypothetical protein H4219_001890 [Mycoemilia scoparia]